MSNDRSKRRNPEDTPGGSRRTGAVDEPQEVTPALPVNGPISQPLATYEIEDLDVLYSFLQESSEHLETVEQKVIRLEQSNSAEVVDEIFRSMHTIKGTSAFFGPNSITELSHRLESLLDALRKGSIRVSAELIDVLLAGADELSAMVAHLGAEARSRAGSPVPMTIPERDGHVGEILDRISKLEAEGLSPEAVAAGTNDDNIVTDELRASFIAETEDLLTQAEADILALENDPGGIERIDRPFRNIHTIKGNAGFLGLAQVEQLCSQIEDVLHVLRNGEKRASQPIITAILQSFDSLLRFVRTGALPHQDDAAVDRMPEDEQYRPLGKILVELGLADEDAVEQALELQERKLGEILVAQGSATEEGINEALTRQRRRMEEAPGTAEAERKAIRVDVAKLDKLFELVGELITAEAMVVSNPDLDGLDLEQFNRSASYLGKITRQIQEIAMSVRMIPLDGLFGKMRRLVRDLSRRTGKPVEIDVTGEDTETDRNVIEALADPLVHIIRNSIDHGIEDPANRAATDKPSQGLIRLSARYEGSEIWINIRDDGRGLHRDAILAKAITNGLTTEEESRTLPDERVWDFLFHPGFSTAAKVSDVSGRGVGMDVVKRNIQLLRGKIDVRTAAGYWTEVILKIPLTMAIIDGVTTRVGNILYAIPLGDIREFHRVVPNQITATATSGEVLRLRESVIPIIRLRTFFHDATVRDTDTGGVFIVVQSGGERAALLVDEIVGYHQIVIKALPEYMGQMKGLSGCSVMGNGDVSLIVDTSTLLKRRVA